MLDTLYLSYFWLTQKEKIGSLSAIHLVDIWELINSDPFKSRFPNLSDAPSEAFGKIPVMSKLGIMLASTSLAAFTLSLGSDK